MNDEAKHSDEQRLTTYRQLLRMCLRQVWKITYNKEDSKYTIGPGIVIGVDDEGELAQQVRSKRQTISPIAFF